MKQDDKRNKGRNGPKGKKKSAPRGKQYSGKRSDRDGFDAREADADKSKTMSGKLDSLNDLSWYTRYPQLVEAAARIPYPNKPGSQFYVSTFQQGAGVTLFTVPSVMSLSWVPTIGLNSKPTDPANLVAREVYARVRKVYSGALDADPPDFMIYLMGLDSIFTYIGWLKRVYRTISLYSPDNYAFPDHFLDAYGFNATSRSQLVAEKTKLWQYINELVYMSRRFTCPAVMDLFNRHYWMSDNVYADAPSPKAQMYIFNVVGVYQYDTDADGAGMLKMQSIPVVASSASGDRDVVDALFRFGKTLINAFNDWDDSFTINGYLQRAYDGVPNFVVQELEQNETLTPVYVEEVLAQIENSTTLPGLAASTRVSLTSISNDILQNANKTDVVCAPLYTPPTSGEVIFSNRFTQPFISVRSDMPTVADNLIATRLKAFVQTGGSGGNPVICGTELPLVWQLYSARTTENVGEPFALPIDSAIMQGTGSSSPDLTYYLRLVGTWLIQSFDWHPLYSATISSTKVEVPSGNQYFCGDIHNITQITPEVLQEIHKMCIYSEFNAFSQV